MVTGIKSFNIWVKSFLSYVLKYLCYFNLKLKDKYYEIYKSMVKMYELFYYW